MLKVNYPDLVCTFGVVQHVSLYFYSQVCVRSIEIRPCKMEPSTVSTPKLAKQQVLTVTVAAPVNMSTGSAALFKRTK